MSSLRDYMSSVINLDEVPTQEQAREVPPLSTEGYIELLKELHILTRDGKLNQDSRRKLKQV